MNEQIDILKEQLITLLSKEKINIEDVKNTLYDFTKDSHAPNNYKISQRDVLTVIHSNSIYGNENKIIGYGPKSKTIYNVEHIVPQSVFKHKEPMRGDMHHLYPANPEINRIRGNVEFKEIDDGVDKAGYETKLKPGTEEVIAFEPPEVSKGNIARAIAYFCTRYPAHEKVVLKKILSPNLMVLWNRIDPVNNAEKDRNIRVYNIQKNLNPYILFPQLIDVVYGHYIESDIRQLVDGVQHIVKKDEITNSSNILLTVLRGSDQSNNLENI